MTLLKWTGSAALVVVVGVGCHKRPPSVAPAAAAPATPTVPGRPPAPPRPPVPAQPAAVAPALSEEELFRRKSISQLNEEQPLADAFFDYDQTTLRADGRTALQKDAEWLTKWRQTTITVEGYCDERGSAEYNLALGERRASVVRQYLESLGVGSSRIRTVSLGKEARFCQASNEECWGKNRRGHFVITGK